MDRYNIVVSEPWDFHGEAGENLITGEIIRHISDTCLLFLSDNYVRHGDVTSKNLVLLPRYTKTDFSKGTENITVNIGLLANFSDINRAEDLADKVTVFGSGKIQRKN
jgi:hypothetical protein